MVDSSAVEIQAAPSPQPVSSFDSFPVSDEIKAGVAALGYKTPTEVQAAVIEPAVLGKDVVVQAKTGSGKTCAFAVPLLDRVAKNPGKPHEPRALILTPTRELAHQVAQEVRAIGAPKSLRVYAIYGGVPMGRQVVSLRGGVDVVVGTPGRLLDHIRRKNLTLAGLEVVVLDEADEMLSMGFWDEVTDILKLCPPERQTMLYSATLPYEVAKAAAQYLRDPTRVDVSKDNLTVEGIENIIVHTVQDMPKPRQLLYLLESICPESAIIFCNTRNETELMAKFLTQSGFVAEPLSGNMRQKDRERVMARIKSGELKYMVATDIAARGIDINDLSHVFNYSLPEFTEVYLHRVGRTGRIGKLGTAVSLVDGVGLATLSRLEREFGVKVIEKAMPPEEEASRKRSERIMKELSEKASVSEVGAHLPVAQQILSSAESAQIVAYLLKSYYAQAAAEGERRARTQGGLRGRERPENGNGEAVAAGENDGEQGGRRRRRRRRGRRGDRGDRPERGDRGERSERQGEPYEMMNVHEALGTVPSAPEAASAAVNENGAPVAGVANDAAAPGNGQIPATEPANDGYKRIRVNIGFDDGFKGRGSVAKRVAALAGLTEGSVLEVESRREYSVLKASPEIAELVIDRVDGTPIGKKVLTVQLA
jgi:ATP-dependent RNA helicase DeaD